MHVYKKRIAPVPTTRLGCNCLTSWFVGGMVPVIGESEALNVQDSGWPVRNLKK